MPRYGVCFPNKHFAWKKSPTESSDMAARVIHFGPDDCHRLIVLESAGYAVDACDSLGQLRASLTAGGEGAPGVGREGQRAVPPTGVLVARTHPPSPPGA